MVGEENHDFEESTSLSSTQENFQQEVDSIEDDNGSSNEDQNGKRTQIRRELKYPLPDSRVSVERQIKILRSLNIAGGKGKSFVSSKEVATFAGMHHTIISGVLSFFFSIGLLEKETNSYKPRQEIIDFCNELEWNEGSAGKVLGKAFSKTWFGDFIPKIFLIDKEIAKDILIQKLGLHVGADQYHKNQIIRLIDLLEYAEIISFDEETQMYVSLIDSKEKTSGSSVELSPINVVKEIQPPKVSQGMSVVNKEKKVEDMFDGTKTNALQQKSSVSLINPTKKDLSSEARFFNKDSLQININLSIGEDSDIDVISENILKLKKKLGMI